MVKLLDTGSHKQPRTGRDGAPQHGQILWRDQFLNDGNQRVLHSNSTMHAMLSARDKSTGTITVLLRRARTGDKKAGEELFSRVYDDLRSLARRVIARSRVGKAVDGTSLVHSACERLLGKDQLDADDRKHFFFLFGRAMHDVLVEELRSNLAAKRGGSRRHEPFVDFMVRDTDRISLMDLRAAIDELRSHDPESAEIVMLRFFCGRTLEESAELMGSTFAVARRHWDYAKAWLHDRLSKPSDTAPIK